MGCGAISRFPSGTRNTIEVMIPSLGLWHTSDPRGNRAYCWSLFLQLKNWSKYRKKLGKNIRFFSRTGLPSSKLGTLIESDVKTYVRVSVDKRDSMAFLCWFIAGEVETPASKMRKRRMLTRTICCEDRTNPEPRLPGRETLGHDGRRLRPGTASHPERGPAAGAAPARRLRVERPVVDQSIVPIAGLPVGRPRLRRLDEQPSRQHLRPPARQSRPGRRRFLGVLVRILPHVNVLFVNLTPDPIQ